MVSTQPSSPNLTKTAKHKKKIFKFFSPHWTDNFPASLLYRVEDKVKKMQKGYKAYSDGKSKRNTKKKESCKKYLQIPYSFFFFTSKANPCLTFR